MSEIKSRAVITFLFFVWLRLAGSQFPYLELTPCPLHWKHSLNLWTTKEVQVYTFSL